MALQPQCCTSLWRFTDLCCSELALTSLWCHHALSPCFIPSTAQSFLTTGFSRQIHAMTVVSTQ